MTECEVPNGESDIIIGPKSSRDEPIRTRHDSLAPSRPGRFGVHAESDGTAVRSRPIAKRQTPRSSRRRCSAVGDRRPDSDAEISEAGKRRRIPEKAVRVRVSTQGRIDLSAGAVFRPASVPGDTSRVAGGLNTDVSTARQDPQFEGSDRLLC